MPQNDPERDTELGVRSIRLPKHVWEALDKDAKRCRRSPVRHLEAMLVRYYDLEESVELDEEILNATAHAVSHRPRQKKVA